MKRLDANEVFPLLHQGSVPPEGDTLQRRRFAMLVLSAAEHQPPASRFPGVHVIHCPLNDHPGGLRPEEVKAWRTASEKVLRAICDGKKVLVTCYAGLNRSGVINARVIMRKGFEVEQAVSFVRMGRGEAALSNSAFRLLLYQEGVRRMRRRP